MLMLKNFLRKNCAVMTVYFLFVVYFVTGVGTNNFYRNISESIHDHSYAALLLLAAQLLLWKKDRNKFTPNMILTFSALLVINVYFLSDSYLKIGEKAGIFLNLLAAISGIVLVIQASAWFITLFLRTKSKR